MVCSHCSTCTCGCQISQARHADKKCFAQSASSSRRARYACLVAMRRQFWGTIRCTAVTDKRAAAENGNPIFNSRTREQAECSAWRLCVAISDQLAFAMEPHESAPGPASRLNELILTKVCNKLRPSPVSLAVAGLGHRSDTGDAAARSGEGSTRISSIFNQ